MVIKSLQQDNFGDWTSERVQNNSSTFTKQLESLPFFGGRLIENLVLSGSTKNVEHKLSKKVQGYIVTKRSNGNVVYSSTIDDKIIQLTATGSVTVDIWIY